jgi:AraC-like DNA-binding protein
MNRNKSILEKLSPGYEKNTKEGDEFAQHILDADFNFSFLSKVESITPTVSLQVKENLNYVQSYCKNVIVGPTFYTRRKDLKSYTMILTLDGQGELLYRKKRYKLNPGDCCFINCQEEHSYHTLSQSGWKLTQVHFYGEKLDYIYRIWESYHHPVVSVSGHPTFGATLEALGEHCNSSTISHTLAVDCNISYLLSILVNACIYQNESNYPKKIKKICQYIDAHYAEPLSLEQIAEQNFISKYYLSREFKKYTGQTPIDYLRSVRMSQAKILLTSTDLSITDVAQRVGFEYTNYFQSVFKKYEGITPLHYRKQWVTS